MDGKILWRAIVASCLPFASTIAEGAIVFIPANPLPGQTVPIQLVDQYFSSTVIKRHRDHHGLDVQG